LLREDQLIAIESEPDRVADGYPTGEPPMLPGVQASKAVVRSDPKIDHGLRGTATPQPGPERVLLLR